MFFKQILRKMGFDEDDPFSKLESDDTGKGTNEPVENIPLEILDEKTSDEEDDDPFDKMGDDSTQANTNLNPSTTGVDTNNFTPHSGKHDPFAQLQSPSAGGTNTIETSEVATPTPLDAQNTSLSFDVAAFTNSGINRNADEMDLRAGPSDMVGEMEQPFIPGADPELAPPSGHDVTPDQPDPFDDLMADLQRGKEAIQDFQDKQQDILDMTGVNIQDAPPADLMDKQEKGTKSYFKLLEEKLFPGHKERVAVDPEENEIALRKLKFLYEKISLDSINYRAKGNLSRQWALIFRLLSSALAAVVTVLLGINITDTLRDYGVDWFINTAALIISAFISIIGVIQSFFDANELYIKYLDTANQLGRLGATVEYLGYSGEKDEFGGKKFENKYVSLDHVNAIKIEYDRILKSLFDYIVQVRADDRDKAQTITQSNIQSSENGSEK